MNRLVPNCSVAKATTRPAIGKAKQQTESKKVYNCNNCGQPGHDQKSCPFKDECLQCKTKAHCYWKQGCPLFDAWAAKKDAARAKAGYPPFKANVAIEAPGVLDEVAALKLEILELQKALKVKYIDDLLKLKIANLERLEKKVLLDSGANISIIADPSHVDANTIPSCRRATKSSGVETADKTVMEITGDGIILGCAGVMCDAASHSLVSLSQFTKTHYAVVISDSVGAIACKRDEYFDTVSNELKRHCFDKQHVLFNSHINSDSLYEITTHRVPVVNAPISDMSTPVKDMSAAKVTEATLDWLPDEATVERHEVAVEAYTFGSHYFTAECQTLRDLVRFFHEAWDHPSKDLMCKIIDQKMFSNIPDKLTAKVVRKHFPHCEACPAGNMAQNPIPREASDREFVAGEELMIDIKVWANNSKALKHRGAFKRYTSALTAIDMATRYKIGKPLTSHKSLEVALEELRVEVHGAGHTLRVLRMDNEFWTAPVRTWAASCEPPIELQPCIPHEHHSIGDVERFNRTLEDVVFKKL